MSMHFIFTMHVTLPLANWIGTGVQLDYVVNRGLMVLTVSCDNKLYIL